MDLVSIMLSELGQIQKDKCHVSSQMQNLSVCVGVRYRCVGELYGSRRWMTDRGRGLKRRKG